MTTTVPFGAEDVTPTEKTAGVHSIFSRVATQYDIMNDVMSFGVHRLWKKSFVAQLSPKPHQTFLDVAGGTGDIAAMIRYATQGVARVVVCDLTYSMLHQGQHRQKMPLHYVCGDAQTLPFAEHSFDSYTISFGLRNVAQRDLALREAWRVLKPHGRFLCLEFSHVAYGGLRQLYQCYAQQVIPWWGQMIAKDRAAYRYLVDSIARFANQQQLCNEMIQAGFSNVAYRNLSAGIVAIHSGIKL